MFARPKIHVVKIKVSKAFSARDHFLHKLWTSVQIQTSFTGKHKLFVRCFIKTRLMSPDTIKNGQKSPAE